MKRKDGGLRPDPHLARVIRNQAKILRNRRLAGEHLVYERERGELIRHPPDGTVTVLKDRNGRVTVQS